MISITGVTVKNVAKGILGVAFFQFITAGTVFVLANVPLPGLWAFAVLVFAILQLPSVIVMGNLSSDLPFLGKRACSGCPVGDSTAAPLPSDNVLKPLLMEKVPPCQCWSISWALFGAFCFLLIGLFTGAIVLFSRLQPDGALDRGRAELTEFPISGTGLVF